MSSILAIAIALLHARARECLRSLPHVCMSSCHCRYPKALVDMLSGRAHPCVIFSTSLWSLYCQVSFGSSLTRNLTQVLRIRNPFRQIATALLSCMCSRGKGVGIKRRRMATLQTRATVAHRASLPTEHPSQTLLLPSPAHVGRADAWVGVERDLKAISTLRRGGESSGWRKLFEDNLQSMKVGLA